MGNCISAADEHGDITHFGLNRPARPLAALGPLQPGMAVFVTCHNAPGTKHCSAPYMVKGSSWMSFGATGFLVAGGKSGPDVVLASLEGEGSVRRVSLSELLEDERVEQLCISAAPHLTPHEVDQIEEHARQAVGKNVLARRVMLLGCPGKRAFIAALLAEMLLRAGRVVKVAGSGGQDDMYGPPKCVTFRSWILDLTPVALKHSSTNPSPLFNGQAGKDAGSKTASSYTRSSNPASSTDITSQGLSSASSNASQQLVSTSQATNAGGAAGVPAQRKRASSRSGSNDMSGDISSAPNALSSQHTTASTDLPLAPPKTTPHAAERTSPVQVSAFASAAAQPFGAPLERGSAKSAAAAAVGTSTSPTAKGVAAALPPASHTTTTTSSTASSILSMIVSRASYMWAGHTDPAANGAVPVHVAKA